MKNHIVIFASFFLAATAFAVPKETAEPPAKDGATKAPKPITDQEVKTVADAHIGDVKACMGEHGAATGKLLVEFVVSPAGKVTEAKPKQHSSNAALDACIAKAFTKWAFPKPRDGIAMGIIYPFMFAAPPPPKAPGTFTAEQITAVVHAKQADVDACVVIAQNAKEPTTGTVKVAIVISAAGAVTESKVHETNTKSPTLDACLVGKVKTWTFPKPTGDNEAAILYPFSFK